MRKVPLSLAASEQADLDGRQGPAAKWAMDLVVTVARCLGAPNLVPIKQAHLVGAYHSGHANIRFLEKLVEWDAQVRVPTTLNASSADLSSGSAGCFAGSERRAAKKVVSLLQQMGCTASLTCAPYFLPDRPRYGDPIAWAESNAVLYANSVIGARTLKCPQYFDMACAITGRTPYAGAMCDQGRKPQLVINVSHLSASWFDDGSLGSQLVGYAVGVAAGNQVALIQGMPRRLDGAALQGLCAAAGVSGSMEMLHVEGSTPESVGLGPEVDDCPVVFLEDSDIGELLRRWQPERGTDPEAVCIGAPHAGPDQIVELSERLGAREGPLQIPIYLSMGRAVHQDPQLGTTLQQLRARGVTIVRDTCTYYGALMKQYEGLVLTNSLKWAAYAAAGLGCTPFLATLRECVDSATAGALKKNGRNQRVGR